MTPAILALASLALLAILCLGYPAPTIANAGTNGMWRITVLTLEKCGNDPVVQVAQYAHENTERVLKWVMVLLAANAAAWLARWLGASDLDQAIYAVGAGVVAWGVRNAAPIRRQREYVGHTVEVLHVERGGTQVDYRSGEIGRMRTGPKYGSLFTGHDIAAGLRRAAPLAKFMLWCIEPAIKRAKGTFMADPNPAPMPIDPITPPDPLAAPVRPKPTPTPTPTPTPS